MIYMYVFWFLFHVYCVLLPLVVFSMYRPVCGVPVIIYLIFAQHLIKKYYSSTYLLCREMVVFSFEYHTKPVSTL